jgi:hypothetical protein
LSTTVREKVNGDCKPLKKETIFPTRSRVLKLTVMNAMSTDTTESLMF